MQTIFTVQSDYAGSVALRNEYDEPVAEDVLRLEDCDLDSDDVYAAVAAATARMIRTVSGLPAETEQVVVIERGSAAWRRLLQTLIDDDVTHLHLNVRSGSVAVKANEQVWSPTLSGTSR